MPLRLSILDETSSGARRGAGSFQFETARLTLRELIRNRVQQEVDRFNAAPEQLFYGLVQPEQTERILNGEREHLALDPERHFQKALQVFRSNGFLVLVGERQITELDEVLHLSPESNVTFLKLVPLIGG